MKGGGLKRAFEVFDAVCDLPPEERGAALQARCGDDVALRREVEELLRSDDHPLTEFDRSPVSLTPPRLHTRIGDYEILGQLGVGGMGVVYEAMQRSPHRKVALKLMRSTLMTPAHLRRFEDEAAVLGYLNHPGIATVYEAGSADVDGVRHPFLAMERIVGFPLDHYVRESLLGIPERLELMARIADAVHHAHQKGVIHRDLKPANVLVDAAGQPKVLDFGIARITAADLDVATHATTAGEILGTLPYMSPEQVQGNAAELDTRTDVYSLGVVLYEVLSGRKPHDVTAQQMVQAVRTIASVDPPALGTLDARLRGDVEVIVRKAMDKDKEDRYSSAADLADDLRRYLANEPIRARPASTAYQLQKFARRNKLLVTGAASTLAALVLGLIGTLTFAYRASERSESLALQKTAAEQAAARAELEAATYEEVVEFLVSLFRGSNPLDGGASGMTAKELLDRGQARIEELADRPAIQARLLDQIGRSYQFLGFTAEAEPLLRRSVAINEELYGPDSLEVAEPLHRLALILVVRDPEKALEHFTRVLAIHESFQPGNDHKVAESLNNLALALGGLGRHGEAREACLEAIRIREAESPPNLASLAVARVNYAAGCWDMGQIDEALQQYGAALEAAKALPPTHHVRTMVIAHVASAIKGVGRHDEAEALLTEVATHSALTYGEDSSIHAANLQGLANAKRFAGKYDEAIELNYQALEIFRERGDEPNVADVLTVLGDAQRAAGEYDEAQELLFEALEIRERILPADSPDLARTLAHLGTLKNRRGEFEEAETYLLEALAVLPDPGTAPDMHAILLARLGNHYERAGPPERALEFLERARALQVELFGQKHWAVAYALERMAAVHREQGRFEDSERLLIEAVGIHDSGASSPPEVATCLSDYGRLLYRHLERPGDAEPYLRRAHDLRLAGPDRSESLLATCTLDLAECLLLLERGDEARALVQRLQDEFPEIANGPLDHSQRYRDVQRRLD